MRAEFRFIEAHLKGVQRRDLIKALRKEFDVTLDTKGGKGSHGALRRGPLTGWLPVDPDVSVKTVKNICESLDIDPRDLERALGRRPKEAAGIVDLKGVDGRLSRDIVDKAMSLEWNDPSRDAFLRSVAGGLSGKIREWSDGQVLRNKDADDRFQDIRVLVRAAHPLVSARGAFRVDTQGQKAEVILNLNKLLPVEVQSPGQMYRHILNTITHELRHAADWAYGPSRFISENPNTDPNLSKNDPDAYVNTPTELKSWAGSVADVLIDRVPNVAELDGPNLEQRIRSYAGNVLKLVREENRPDFLRRVVKALERRVQERRRMTAALHRVANKKLKGLERMLGEPVNQAAKDVIKKADPDGKKGYLNLAVRLARQAAGDPNSPDVEKADDMFADVAFKLVKQYDSNREYAEVKDLGQINTLEEFEQAIREATQRAYAEPRPERAEFEVLSPKVIRLDSKDAAALISGGDTPWCFGKWKQNHYESYDSNGDLYIVLPDGPDTSKTVAGREVPYADNRFGVHLTGNAISEIKDANNQPVGDDEEQAVANVLSEVLGEELEVGGSWREYGLDREEWVEAGFDDPDEAYYWSNHGFDAENAAAYVAAGWDDPEESSGWYQLGFDAALAKLLSDEQIEPYDAYSMDLEIKSYPELSAFLRLRGSDSIQEIVSDTGGDLKKYADAWFDLYDRGALQSADNETLVRMLLINHAEGLKMSADEVATIHRAVEEDSESYADAEYLHKVMTSGLAPERIAEWVERGEEATGFASENLDAALSGLTVDEWSQVAPQIEGRNIADKAEEIRKWTEQGMSAESIALWKNAGWQPGMAARWAPFFSNPEEAKRWEAVGWNPADAMRQRNLGKGPDDEMAWDPLAEAMSKHVEYSVEELAPVAQATRENDHPQHLVVTLMRSADPGTAIEILQKLSPTALTRLVNMQTDPVAKNTSLSDAAMRTIELTQAAGIDDREAAGYAVTDVDIPTIVRYLQSAPPESFKGSNEKSFQTAVRRNRLDEAISKNERWKSFHDEGLRAVNFPERMSLEEAKTWAQLDDVFKEGGDRTKDLMRLYNVRDAAAIQNAFNLSNRGALHRFLDEYAQEYRLASDMKAFIEIVQEYRSNNE